MNEQKSLVVLGDDEVNLNHYLELLREDGWTVLSTDRPYEAALWLARRQVGVFMARNALLPDSNGDFLRQIRDSHPRPITIIALPSDQKPNQPSSLVDIFLREPFTFQELDDAVAFGQRGRRATYEPMSQEEETDDGRDLRTQLPKVLQVINAARALTEQERDRDQLLSEALEYFMEITDSGRGSIMLRVEGTEALQVVRRAGFPSDSKGPFELDIGAEIAGQVVSQDVPLLVEDVNTEFPNRPERGYEGDSFLVVPLTDQQTSLGVVNLTDKRGGEAYTRENLIHAMMLADQTAITLANARVLEDLHAMTVIDPLTQLYNRRHFDRELKKELERARRYGRQLSLALFDIDNFKLFNDLNGYVTGDAILKSVAEVLKECFRESDTVTRWGGDEFAVLLPETGRAATISSPRDGTKHFIERVAEAVEKTDFRSALPELAGRITVSVGVATFPVDCAQEEQLFNRANQALHRAKRLGTNRVCFAAELPKDGGEPGSRSALAD